MSFAAPIFLWYFMPAVLLIYWLLPGRWRNGLLAIASLVFYTYGAGPFVFLLLACIVVNFAAGIGVDSSQLEARPRVRRTILVTAIVFDVSVLAIWKYAGFASRQIHSFSDALGLGATPVVSLALPIGISFFTFHHLSYVVDVYRHSRPAQKSPVQFVTYIAMFPQLIAGPIVRYHEIAEQLADTSRAKMADFAEGFPRFALGLCKKVIIADTIAPVANAMFATSPADLTTGSAWIGALAYTVQIYFDFSGYSDMAIGLAQMFGLRLPGELQPAILVALDHRLLASLAYVVLAVVLLPASYVTGRFLDRRDIAWSAPVRWAVLAVMPYAAILIAAGTFSPFLYFQF